jgi:hypothetical protein
MWRQACRTNKKSCKRRALPAIFARYCQRDGGSLNYFNSHIVRIKFSAIDIFYLQYIRAGGTRQTVELSQVSTKRSLFWLSNQSQTAPPLKALKVY